MKSAGRLLAPYQRSRSVKTGVWLKALGNEHQRRPMRCKARARERLYVTFTYLESTDIFTSTV